MARMIPASGPREFDPRSREGIIYNALSLLPDDYYVIHSFDCVLVQDCQLNEHELDFVIFNPSLGIMVVEAKAGRISYENGEWLYGNGLSMRGGGPYLQASRNKYMLMDTFSEKGLEREKRRCKFLSAVWFPSISRQQLQAVNLPQEASLQFTLCSDDLSDPEPKVRSIFALKVGNVETGLDEADAKRIVQRVLCPSFNIVPTKRYEYDLAEAAFSRLLDSQIRILDFIQDQRSAVISGYAGCGKTLIAVEHVKREALKGNKTLFLCYNALLKQDVERRLKDWDTIDVMTIAGLACRLCSTSSADYEKLAELLCGEAADRVFPYTSVVIDEGQDFSIEAIDNSMVLELLRDLMEQRNGKFFVFYDKNQMVQGTKLPSIVEDADCRLTLYVNCRNSKTIATCSNRAICNSVVQLTKNSFNAGGPPILFASTNKQELVDRVDHYIDSLKNKGIDNMVVLTCKTEDSSLFSDCFAKRTTDFSGIEIDRTWKQTAIPVSTCRKFKGLEADAVILVDVDESVWDDAANRYSPGPGILFYTGASRAKFELRLLCTMDEADCEKVLKILDSPSARKPISKLAKNLGAILERSER